MKINVLNIGCRVNSAETQEWEKIIKKRGVLKKKKSLNLSIINSCSVTKEAQKKTKKIIKKLEKKKHLIIITGCFVKKNQIFKNKIFIKNKKKKIIKKILKKINIEKKKEIKKKKKVFLKIQEGCNNKCTYCIVFKKRKKENSLTPKSINNKIRKLIKKKKNSITLTGINLSNYKSEKKNLKNIIKEILKKNKIKNLELGSLEIKTIPKSLYKIWKNKIIKKLIHVPIQSGSDIILKLMNRKYYCEKFKKIVKNFKNNIKNISFITDIIIGFNKEEEEEFKKTKKIIKDLKIQNIHLFRYSKVRGIFSLSFDKEIKEKEKIKKIKQINKLLKEIKKYKKKKINKNILYKK